jgi:hypothetical protein
MEPVDIIGAGLLGDLKYNESEHLWALSLGEQLERFRHEQPLYARSKHGSSEVSRLKAAINRILATNSIYLTVDVALKTSHDVDTAIKKIQDEVRHKGATAFALVCIGQCSYAFQHYDDSHVHATVEHQMANITYQARSLGLESKVFGKILLDLPKRNTMAPIQLSRLLVELSLPLTVLVISSSPRDQRPLRHGEERRELEKAIRASRFRDSLQLRDTTSCRVQDIPDALDQHHPNILHFSGHANAHGLLFEDDQGKAVLVEQTYLANLLRGQENLKLVFLNACYTYAQAQCIADAVGYAIAVNEELHDHKAIEFSRAFYKALGHGRTFRDSFDRAKNEIALSYDLQVYFLTATQYDSESEDGSSPPGMLIDETWSHVPQITYYGEGAHMEPATEQEWTH